MRPHSSNIAIIVLGTLVYFFTIQYYYKEIAQLNAALAEQARKIETLQINANDSPQQTTITTPIAPNSTESPLEQSTTLNTTLQRKKSPICLLTAFHNKDVVELTLPYFLEYANHWGYPFFFYHSNKYVQRLENFKFKIRLIERYLDYCEYVAWFDSDIIFTNFSIPLESFIDTRYEFLAAGPSRTGTSWSLNAGAMFVHSSHWTRRLLTQVYALTHLDDQQALQQLLQRVEYVSRAQMLAWKQLQQPYKSSRVGQWQRGDFCIHFWGSEKGLIAQFLTEQRLVLNRESYPFEPFVLGKNRPVEKWTN